MASRWLSACAAGVLVVACSGSEFESEGGTGGTAGDAGATGGSGGSGAAGTGGGGGSTASGGSSGAGTGGGAGTVSNGGTSNGGSAGSSGAAGSGGSGVPISIVQATPIQIISGDDPTISFNTAPTAGNTLIVGISCFSEVDNCTIPSGGVTDNQGNVYVRLLEGYSILNETHGARPYVFVAENIPAPNGTLSITVNPNGMYPTNFQAFSWGVLEVAGLAASSALDATGKASKGSNATMTTVSTTTQTAQANELAVAIITMRSNDDDVAFVHDATWTEHHLHVNGNSGGPPHQLVTKILLATEQVSHTWTHDVPTRGSSAIIATFRGSDPGGG